MIDEISAKFDEYKTDLEQIILRKVSLRYPPISVVRIPVAHARDLYKRQIMLFKQLKDRYPDWTYELVNVESLFYDLLKELEYVGGDEFAKTESRDLLKSDLLGSKSFLIERIVKKIHDLRDKSRNQDYQPLLVLLNMHASYPFVETSDVIRVINTEKGVFTLIFYIQGESYTKEEESKTFDYGNYRVHSYSLLPGN